jgi:hypothetical protein
VRFDVLDEYSTLVPFGLGVSRRNRVVEYPAAPAKPVKHGAIARCVSLLKKLYGKAKSKPQGCHSVARLDKDRLEAAMTMASSADRVSAGPVNRS